MPGWFGSLLRLPWRPDLFAIAIAVAVLGRNRALGVFFSALLFGALLTGTSTRNLDPTVFRPDLAGNLTLATAHHNLNGFGPTFSEMSSPVA